MWNRILLLVLLCGLLPIQAQTSEIAGLKLEDSSGRNDYALENGVFIIKSRMGIGTVVLRPTGESWPELTTVRFEYKGGQGMKVLEDLEIRFDELAPRHIRRRPPTKLKDGALHWDLPPELPQSTKYMHIHWVDFFRR